MSSLYEYTPLNGLPDDTIRLLQICPGLPCKKIACSISTAQLTLRPKFAALSYEWGTEPASEEIQLNGRQFWIRKNLWNCLIRLRHPAEPLVIWVDAVCVNQDDIPERNQQVKFMNDIFTSAEPVFGWLGEDTGMSVDAVCPNFAEDLRQFDFDRFENLIQEYNKKAQQHLATLLLAEDFPEFESKVMQICSATSLLCQSHYWNRVWIVQEVIVAQNLILCYAGQRLSWVDFRSLCSKLTPMQLSGRPASQTVPMMYKAIWNCSLAIGRRVGDFALHHRSTVATVNSLHDLIARYGGRECSDVRDKIFALLGLVDDRDVHRPQNQLTLRADYATSHADLFLDVMVSERVQRAKSVEQLRQLLELDFQEVEQAALRRSNDTFVSTMRLEAKIDSVVFRKLCELPGWPVCRLRAVLIVYETSRSDDLFDDSDMQDTLLLALVSGEHAVKAGDFVFRLRHSDIFAVFRYEQGWLRFIGWLEKFTPDHKTAQSLWAAHAQHFTSLSLQLKDIYAPSIEFEVQHSQQKIEFGCDLFLKWMRRLCLEGGWGVCFREWIGSD